jgi:hypothetical protein
VSSTTSVQRGRKEVNWANRLSSVWEAVKTKNNWKIVGREPLFRDDLRAKAQESPLLVAVTSKRVYRDGAVIACNSYSFANK